MHAEAERHGSSDHLCHRDGITLVPYVEVNGVRTLDDAHVLAALQGLIDDGTLGTVFPAAEILEPDDFLLFAKQPGVHLTLMYVDDQLAGFAWLSDLRHRWALGNFAMLKRIWGQRTVAVGQHVLDLWFSMAHQGRPIFDTIGGVIPSTNTRAIRYIQRLGFTVIGEIPIGERGVVVSYLTREQFYGRR